MKGILYKNLSIAAFTLMALCMKMTGERYHAWQLVFFRSFFTLLPALWLLSRETGGFALLKTTRPHLHALRGLAGLLSMVTIFGSYRYMSLTHINTLLMSTPVFIALLSIALLHERVTPLRWGAIALGLAGVLFALQKDADPDSARLLLSWPSLVVLGGAFFTACVHVMIRHMSSRGEPSLVIIVYFMALASGVSALMLPGHWQTPSSFDLTWLVGSGIAGAFGQVFMVAAYREAEASSVAPWDFLTVIYSIGLDLMLWRQWPHAQEWLGMALVGAAAYLLLRAESVKKRAPASRAAS